MDTTYLWAVIPRSRNMNFLLGIYMYTVHDYHSVYYIGMLPLPLTVASEGFSGSPTKLAGGDCYCIALVSYVCIDCSKGVGKRITLMSNFNVSNKTKLSGLHWKGSDEFACIWANYSDKTASWSPQMVKSKGIHVLHCFCSDFWSTLKYFLTRKPLEPSVFFVHHSLPLPSLAIPVPLSFNSP